MTLFEETIYNLKKLFFMCPECKGEGGETDVILDNGSGPWYRCEVCGGKGYMNGLDKIYWKIRFIYYEWSNNRWKKRSKR